VLEYAAIDGSVRFTGRSTLFVGGKPLGAVPRLAICQNMGETPETFLFHCDDSWNVLGAGAFTSVEVARERAEYAYEGVSAKWRQSSYSLEEAERYLAESWGEHRCAFCGKTPNQVQVLVQGRTGARICDLCVAEMQRTLSEGTARDV
jgi:hypothetical protein